MREGELTVVNDGRLPLFFYDIVTVFQPQFFKSLKLPLNPLHNQHHNKLNLHLIQRPTLLHPIPFLKQRIELLIFAV